MEWRERWAKNPRRRAKWRRSYNRSCRAIVDGLTKRGWSLLWGREDRRCWTKFIAEWDAYFALSPEERSKI